MARKTRWQRAVIYEVEADTLEEAIDIWEGDGPELGSSVSSIDYTDFVAGEEEAVIYELTAQPIHEDGSVGFDKRSPLFVSAPSLAEAFAQMASEDGGDGDVGIGAYIDEFDAWDLTLTVKEER